MTPPLTTPHVVGVESMPQDLEQLADAMLHAARRRVDAHAGPEMDVEGRYQAMVSAACQILMHVAMKRRPVGVEALQCLIGVGVILAPLEPPLRDHCLRMIGIAVEMGHNAGAGLKPQDGEGLQ